MKLLHATASLCAAILLLGIGTALAQPANAPDKRELIEPAAPAPDVTWRAIRLENVKPSLMAYWIDPAHNEFPPFHGKPPELLPMAPQPDAPAEKGLFDLPASIARLVPVDLQNLLFVEGGEFKDVRQLQEIVTLLDQPLREVEVSVQFVEIDAAELGALGIKVTAEDAGKRKVDFMRGAFQATLNALVAEGKAKIIAAPRVTLLNNMTGTVVATQNKGAAAAPTKWSYEVTPTINGDETITLLSKASIEPASGKPSGLVTVINIRNGDTIALTSLPVQPAQAAAPNLADIPTIGGLFPSSKTKGRDTLVLVTARIVRHDKAKPRK